MLTSNKIIHPLHDSAVAIVREALTDPLLRAELIQLLQVKPAVSLDLLDTNAAATRLGMTPKALRAAAGRGTIEFVKVGRRLRFRPETLALLSN